MNDQRDGNQGGNLPSPTETQTGESVAKPNENDMPKQGESFFQIPDDVKAKLTEHPEVVQLMDNVGKQWQTNYYAKREAEAKVNQQIRQDAAEAQAKAGQLDKLMQNPNFTDAMVAEYNRARGVEAPAPRPASNNTEDDFFARFEDGDALQGLVERMVSQVDERVSEKLKPFMADLAQNRELSEITAVQTFIDQERAKGNQLPDLDVNTVRVVMRQHNMGAMDAYKLSVSNFLMSGQKPLMEKLSIQSELGIDGKSASEQTKQTDSSAATTKPGKSGLDNAVPIKLSADEKLAAANKLRESKEPALSTGDIIGELMQQYNIETGENWTL